MKIFGIKILCILLVLNLTFCSRTVLKPGKLSPMERLVKNIEYQLSRPEFSSAKWGVYIESLDTGEIIYKHNENKLFMPASNLKLFTSAAGLVKLGPEYVYKTCLYSDSKIEKNGVINGNLILAGSGDPTISGRFRDGNVTAAFEEWAEKLKDMGVKKISGSIIGDDDLFDDVNLGFSWSWDDLPYWYAASISALSFNDNCIDFYVYPGKEIGSPARIEWKPETKYFTLKNTVRTTKVGNVKNVLFWRDQGTNDISVEGNIPVNSSRYVESISVSNPTLYTSTVLTEVFNKAGIKVEGAPEDIDNLPDTIKEKIGRKTDLILMAEHISPNIAEVIKVINKNSQNFYAEQVLKTVGREYGEKGSFEEGINVVKSMLSGIGINTNEFFMRDGSGLSHQNLIKPSNMAALLKYMHNHRYSKYFYDSLPVAGVDGSLRRRMKNTNAENNVRAKTGYIGHVRSLSGYVTSKDNEKFLFTLIVNHFSVSRSLADDLQDRICVMLANFSR